MDVYNRPKSLKSKRGWSYRITESVGQGAFGHVYRVTIENSKTNCDYVCKVEQR